MEQELIVNDKRPKFDESPNLPAVVDSNAIIFEGMKQKYTTEQIEKMMDLSEGNQKNIARQAYHKAMAEFAAKPPDIEKDKKVSYSTSKGQTNYSHAQLGTSAAKIQAALSPHGLHASRQTTLMLLSVWIVRQEACRPCGDKAA